MRVVAQQRKYLVAPQEWVSSLIIVGGLGSVGLTAIPASHIALGLLTQTQACSAATYHQKSYRLVAHQKTASLLGLQRLQTVQFSALPFVALERRIFGLDSLGKAPEDFADLVLVSVKSFFAWEMPRAESSDSR